VNAVIAIVVGILAFFVMIALLKLALKLIVIVIAVGLAVGAYFVAQKLIGEKGAGS
jgi:hypothetical protein